VNCTLSVIKRYNVRRCPGAASTARGLADLRKQADMEQLTFDQYAAEIRSAVGLCECGCGQPARISKKGNRRYGYVKGQPRRFLRGHANRVHPRVTVPSIEFQTLSSDLLPRPEARAWVYVLWAADREALYVGKVVRFHYMGRLDEHSHKSPWWGEVAFYSAEEVAVSDVLEAESQAIRALQPRYNTANTAKCGTLSGYKRHAARKEEACDPCREASNAHRRERSRSKGVPPAPGRAACGTYAGYLAHLDRNEVTCDECRAANAAYARSRYKARANASSP
jgi:hypothetical protein